jgi:hypothetical protein
MNLTKPFCRPCGKEVHPTAAEARRSIRSYARRLKGNSGQRKTPVDAYACPSGNGWHLTSHRVTRRDRSTR